MKLQYKSLLMAFGALAMMTSCGNRDILEPIVDPGQEVPTTYWEVGSTAAPAGGTFTFQGKYTIPEGRTGDYSEVWYRVKRAESAAATVKLAGAALSYTKTATSNDTMRNYQPVVRKLHSEAEFNGYEYVVKGEVPVSRTLSPVTWIDATTWDADRFASYYPAGFDTEFCAEVINYLTKDSAYYNSLRTVYINYPFTMEQFAAANAKHGVSFPTNIDMSGDDQGSSEKSDLWFDTKEADEKAITGYYYFTLDAAGNAVVHEVGMDQVTKNEDGTIVCNGATCYPVYKSAPWVFCRYNDDLGAIISSVRANWMAAFKDLLGNIKFEEWIYDSANKCYKVEFSRKYSLDTQFRVYDSAGEEGIANDIREITIN